MNFASFWLAIIIVGLRPRLVLGYDLSPASIFEPSSSLLDWVESPGDVFSSMMRRQESLFENALSSLRGSAYYPMVASSEKSPYYEIMNNEDKFQISVEAPGAKPKDMNIRFDERSRMLTVTGHQEKHNEGTGYHFSSRFSRSFQLDPFVEADKLSANMDNGVLTITAPKNTDNMENYQPVRTIPIMSLLDDGEEVDEDEEELKSLPSGKTTGAFHESVPVSARPAPYETTAAVKEADPFHVKERIERARFQVPQYNEDGIPENNPNDVLTENEQGYKTSEFRRRRR